MPNINPGPAITQTVNYPLLTSQQALVLIGMVRNVNTNVLGDTAIPVLETIGATTGTYSVANVVATNANNAGAAIALTSMVAGVFNAQAAGGTAIVAAAAFTGVTAPSVVSQRTVASTAAQTNVQNLYFNISTASGVTGTVDLYIYGYNFS